MNSSPIENRPGYHDTLRQSVQNPVQLERLPDGRALSLEHRTQVATPAERRALYRYFAQRIGWCLLLLVIGKMLSNWRYVAGHFYFAALILMAMTSCARGLLVGRSAALRWTVYLLVCPLLAAPVFLLVRPYYHLALAFVALTLLADQLATHHYFARTSSDKPRPRLWRRLTWKNRFSVLDAVDRRIPFYVLAAAAPMLLFALILYRRSEPYRYLFTDDLYVLGGAVAIAVVAVALFEPLLNFLYQQPIKHPLSMIRCVWRAIMDWATYDLHNRNLPGVFTSPSGPLHARLHLLFGALILLAVPLTELSHYLRFFHPGRAPLSAEGAAAEQPPGELQPYQQAMIAEMAEEQREEYRAQLIAQAAEFDAPPRRPWFVLNEAQTQQQHNEQHVQISALYMLASGSPVLRFILTFLPPLLLVPLVLLICISPAVSRADSEANDQPGEDAPPKLDEALWQHFVTLLQSSPREAEQNSFFLGLNAADRSPVIVPRRVFEEHAHFLGDSGSGKTTLGLAPLISQMIRARNCSVVIIDLKGDDPSLFENARIEAENAGLRFRWFTNELGKATYVFNPLLQRHLAELSLYQRTDLLTASLGLQYGTDYGRGFFSDANAELLYHALRARPHLASFVELSNVLKQREPFRTVSSQLKMAGSHLAAIVTRLGSTEALNARPTPDIPPELLSAAIDMRQPFEEPQVVYFHLSSALGTATSAEIARMAMFSLLSASKFVQGERQQVFLVVDEFQRAVSNNLELFLQTARSMNIGVVLANQSLSDLKKPGVDIVSTVRTNTRFRQLFAVGEKNDLEEVIYTSGETLVHSQSWLQMLGASLIGAGGVVKSRSVSEVVSPRLRINDLLLASDHPLQSVCHIRRGDAFAQYGGMPFIMESAYHISEKEYGERKIASWPEQSVETFTPTLASTDPIASSAAPSLHDPTSETQASAAAAQRLFEGLDQHFQEQQAERLRHRGSQPDSTTED